MVYPFPYVFVGVCVMASIKAEHVAQSFAEFLKKWQPFVATFVGVLCIGVGWGIAWNNVKGDTLAMRERITSVEEKIEKIGGDHDILIELRTDVRHIKETLNKMSNKP